MRTCVLVVATVCLQIFITPVNQAWAAASGPLDPGKPIRWVDPFPPGGGTDLLARTVGPRLTKLLGNTVVVDNRTGAAGTIAVATVAKATPDGYTIGTISATHSIYPSLNPNLPYNILKDLSPVVQLSRQAYVLVANPGFPPSNVAQLIALAKSKPGQINYGSAGLGGLTHLAGALFEILAGVDMSHVPYKGAPPATIDVLSGQIQILFASPIASQPHVKAGRLKILGVTSATRMRAMPDVPTIAESGVPGFDVTGWYGVVAPSKAPKPIIDQLNSTIVQILEMPEVRDQMITVGVEPVGGSPQEFGTFIRQEVAKWDKVVRAARIRIE